VIGRLPRAGLACAFIAFLNAFVWSLVTPYYHVPDEITHVAYTQYLAQTGKLPRPVSGTVYSAEQQQNMDGLGFFSVIGQPRNRPIWSSLQDRSIQSALENHPSRVSQGGSSTAANNPPLYYALETIPYWASPSAELPDRLYLMRVLSAVMAGATVLLTFLFLAELLPGTPWAWTVGALAVAFQPLFGFMTGGVNNDNGVILAAAAVFYLLARAFRHGLTERRALAIGAAVGLGLLMKANLVSFVPGVLAALGVLVWRAAPDRRARAVRAALLAVAVGVAPVLVYAGLNATVWDRPLWAGGTTQVTTGTTSGAGSFREQLSYAWQLYLPRLPFMYDQFGGFPLWQLWFRGFIGRFGWLDYGFPLWVYRLALWFVVPILLLSVAGLVRARHALRRRLPELTSYALAMLGLLALVAAAGYGARRSGAPPFEQARYLLPLLPLYGALVALAARGAGRRWGPAVGGVLVVLAMTHGLFAQLLTISRFYG